MTQEEFDNRVSFALESFIFTLVDVEKNFGCYMKEEQKDSYGLMKRECEILLRKLNGDEK